MPIDDRAPKQAPPPAADKTEKQAAAHQAVDILHEISTILVRRTALINLIRSSLNPDTGFLFFFSPFLNSNLHDSD